MNNVLRRYIVEIIKDIDEDSNETIDVDVNEFSSIGGGSIVGFTAPLGLSGKDIEGPRVKERKKKKKQSTWK
jgi:hypothetical protein